MSIRDKSSFGSTSKTESSFFRCSDILVGPSAGNPENMAFIFFAVASSIAISKSVGAGLSIGLSSSAKGHLFQHHPDRLRPNPNNAVRCRTVLVCPRINAKVLNSIFEILHVCVGWTKNININIVIIWTGQSEGTWWPTITWRCK